MHTSVYNHLIANLMNATSFLVWTGATVGSIAGGYLPTLFGISAFSATSILLSTLGGLLGIYVGYKISQNF